MKISRRSLAKGLAAASTAAGLSGLLRTQPLTGAAPESSAVWRRIYPGVWRATIGTPERFTPVSSRLVPAQVEAFARLPDADARDRRTFAANKPPAGAWCNCRCGRTSRSLGWGCRCFRSHSAARRKLCASMPIQGSIPEIRTRPYRSM